MIEWIKAVLSFFRWVCFNRCKLSQKYKIACSMKISVYEHIISISLSPTMKQLPEKLDLHLKKRSLLLLAKYCYVSTSFFNIYLSSWSWHLFPLLAWVGRFLMKDFQVFLSLAMSVLTFLSFRSLLITSFYVFLGRPLGKLLPTSKVLHLLDEALSSILSRCPNYCSRLSSCSSILV